MLRRVTVMLALASLLVAGAALAVSDAVKMGANAGAMKYCRDHATSDKDKRRYKVLAKRTAEEFDALDMDRGEKVKALAARKRAEDGDYLGDELTEKRCDRLRGKLMVKYKN